jgi:hypothetical protein
VAKATRHGGLGESLATEGDEGEDATATLGVRLEAWRETSVLNIEADHDRDHHGESGDEDERVEPRRSARSRVAERPTMARILEIAKHLLDLHPLGIEADDLRGREVVDGGRKDPRLERTLLIGVIGAAATSSLDLFSDDDAESRALVGRVVGRESPCATSLSEGGLPECSGADGLSAHGS